MADKFAVIGNDQCHNTETGTTCSNHLTTIIKAGVAALTRQAAHRVPKIPKITEGLTLHHIQQGAITQSFYYANRLYTIFGCFWGFLRKAAYSNRTQQNCYQKRLHVVSKLNCYKLGL